MTVNWMIINKYNIKLKNKLSNNPLIGIKTDVIKIKLLNFNKLF